MYITVELVLNAYKPLAIKQGMLFVKKNEDTLEVFEMDHDYMYADAFMEINGCPVELQLFDTSLKELLAIHEEIGWVDEGDNSEDMHEITVDDINVILANRHRCMLNIREKPYNRENMIIPIYDEEKVVIKLIEEE